MGALEGRSVLVTGAGSGLGRAIVERFLAEGAQVAAFDRDHAKLGALQRSASGALAVQQGDVTSFDDNVAAVEAALDRFGRLGVFIGNAGQWDFNRLFEQTAGPDLDAGFDEIFGVNVKGYLLGARAAVDALRESRGSMIFTLSNAAFYPQGGGVLYTASKHPGVGLVRQLAYELAPRIRVNGVAPGGMPTDLRGPKTLGLHESSIGDMPVADYMKKYSALEIAVEPADYVGTYVLLASERDAVTVTGTVFDISSVGTPHRP